jgi:hypothetical protein
VTTFAGQNTTLNTAPLTARVKRRDVRAFYKRFVQDYPIARAPMARFRRFILGVGVFITPFGVFGLLIGFFAELADDEPDKNSELAGMFGFGMLLLVAFCVILWAWLRLRARRDTPKRHYRFTWFALVNRLVYVPGPFVTMHLTPWADHGIFRVARVFRSTGPRPIEIANYELLTGAQGSRNTQFGGYAALRLATSLPHIVLQSRGRGSRRFSLATVPSGAQKLSLEGDFDEHFTLFCPRGYERDALYLFTPDVMTRLMDDVRGYDVEIIDDWLFLVSTRDVVTLSPDRWDALTDAVDAVSAKLTRWERWRDDRLGGESGIDRARALSTAGLAGSSAEIEVDVARQASLAGAGMTAIPGDPRRADPRTAQRGQVSKKGRRLRMGFGIGSLIWIVPTVLVVGALILAQVLPN